MKVLDLGRSFGMNVAHIFKDKATEIPFNYRADDLATAIDKVDLILLGGGADISTDLYGQKNVASGSSTISNRDKLEWDALSIAQAKSKPVLGICRGAQLLCAYNGHQLVQHVNGHAGSKHHVFCVDVEEEIETNSVHHQMMAPNKNDRQTLVLGYTENLSDIYLFDQNAPITVPKNNPEAVYFGRNRSLAIQWHPEFYHNLDAPAVEVVRRWTRKFLLGE